jgi:peptide/nickel transport system permease protein
MVPTLIGMTMVTYLIVRLAPGDPVASLVRNEAGNINPKTMRENTQRIREKLGLIDYHYVRDTFFEAPAEVVPGGPGSPPLPSGAPAPTGVGYNLTLAADAVLSAAVGYVRWLGHLFVGDFGESINQRTSSGSRNPLLLIIERIPVTGILNLIAETLIFVIALPVGLLAARYHGRRFDSVSSFIILALYSIPVILAGTVLIGYLSMGGSGVEWFPNANLHALGSEDFSWPRYLADMFWHAVLPVACLTYGGLAYLAKLSRASLLENLRSDFVRTARAKGLSEARVVYHHAFRNGLLPMITVMVLTLPGLIGGSVIVESIFSLRGTGLLLVNAAQSFDIFLILAETLLYGVLTLIFLLIGDLCYAWADPRVRYE